MSWFLKLGAWNGLIEVGLELLNAVDEVVLSSTSRVVECVAVGITVDGFGLGIGWAI